MGWVVNATPRPLYPRYPLYRRLGGPQGRSGLVRKISPPPGFDPRTVQPATSRSLRLLRYPGLSQKLRNLDNVVHRRRNHIQFLLSLS